MLKIKFKTIYSKVSKESVYLRTWDQKTKVYIQIEKGSQNRGPGKKIILQSRDQQRIVYLRIQLPGLKSQLFSDPNFEIPFILLF